jgi:MFS family permease
LKIGKTIPRRSYLDRRIIAFYLFAFAAGGVIQPFLNLYLVEVGLSGAQIGVIQGWAAVVAIVVTPFIGLYADHTQRHRFLLGLIVFIKGLSAPLMLFSAAWAWLAATVSLRVVTSKTQDALMNRLTLAWLQERGSLNLGSIRFWGALSFALTSLLAGYLASGRSVGVLFPLAGLMGLVAVFFVGVFPAQIAARHPAPQPEKLFSKRPSPLLFLYLIIFIFWLGRSGSETFVYVYLAAELEATNQMIGLLGAVAGLAPLPAFYLADWLRGRHGAVVTMAVGLGFYAVAWAGFGLIAIPPLAIPLNVCKDLDRRFL